MTTVKQLARHWLTPAERIAELEKEALKKYGVYNEFLGAWFFRSNAEAAYARGEAIIAYLNGPCLAVSHDGERQCERRVYHQGAHMRRNYEGGRGASVTSWLVDGDTGAHEDFITDWVAP